MHPSWQLVFHIRSFWQAGTGGGRGVWLDNLARRDHNQLPILPGRTVKGIVRDAVLRAEAWGHLAAGCTDWLFGTQSRPQQITRLATKPSILGFGNASLPADISSWLAKQDQSEHRASLFRELHSTAVNTTLPPDISTHPTNDTGTQSDKDAKNRSLRGIEVVIPITLYAPITVLATPDESGTSMAGNRPEWSVCIRTALPLIRAIGSHRSRGLGRVSVTLEEAHP